MISLEPNTQREALANQLDCCRLGICRMILDENLAEDLYQEVSLRCVRAMGSRDWLVPQYGFIHKVAKRVLIDLRRRSAIRKNGSIASIATDETTSSDERSIETAVKRETDEIVCARLDRLPLHQRTAVEARYLHDDSTAAIAKRLDVPLHTVKTRIYRGIAALRDDPVLRAHVSKNV